MTYDFAPLFRTAIGFDRLVRQMDSSQVATQAYPPYNIERTAEDAYRLTMAVAGFGPDDIELTVKENTLLVAGRVQPEADAGEVLYRGIAPRAFERRFVLADHLVVQSADVRHGLLHVALQRVVPDALKPRRIAVGTGATRAPAISNDTGETAQAA